MKDFLVLAGVLIIGVVIVLFLVTIPILLVNRWSCVRLNVITGLETRYTFSNGCLVKVNNRFIPRENWRGEYQQ